MIQGVAEEDPLEVASCFPPPPLLETEWKKMGIEGFRLQQKNTFPTVRLY